MTINFSVPVKKLSLRITDIDKATGEDSFTDEVIVSPATFEASTGPGSGRARREASWPPWTEISRPTTVT